MPDLDLRLFLPKPPFWLIVAVVIGTVATWVPLSLFLKHRFSYHEQPRVHLFQDMDNQPKLRAQAASPVFADGRAMRPPVPGSVARGHLDGDDHLHRGFALVADGGEAATEYFQGFPESIEVDERFVQHGQARYNALCSPCHGLDGLGQGMIQQRGQALAINKDSGVKLGTVWVAAANLLTVDEASGQLLYGPGLYPEGKLYNTIVNGKANMAGYGHATTVEDRWAIVAYVRALQLAQQPDQMRSAWRQVDAESSVASSQ